MTDKERLARAAFNSRLLGGSFGSKKLEDNLETERAYVVVEAILRELREPSEGMLAAPIIKDGEQWGTVSGFLDNWSATDVWQAMIDHILSQ